MNQWQADLGIMYQGHGITLSYELANGPVNVHGTNINYVSGLSHNWNTPSSYTSAKAEFSLNMSSVGLKGYGFKSTLLLNMTILTVSTSAKQINVTVGQEEGIPVDNLHEYNFKVFSGTTPLNITYVDQSYSLTNTLIYTIQCNQTQSFPQPVDVTVVDQRGIMTISRYP
jgi:hypothetical protein